jgi:alpha-tubulin suppressor-like RCC1 family protein
VPIDNVIKVAIGGTGIFRSSALLKNDGTVMVCGYNGKGQLGLGDTATRSYFETLNIRDYIKDIHWFGSGQDTILTLHTENDDVYICGSGTSGLNTQLRNNNYLVPTPLIF